MIKYSCREVQKIAEFLNSTKLPWLSDNTLMGMVQVSEDIWALGSKCLCSSTQTEQRVVL